MRAKDYIFLSNYFQGLRTDASIGLEKITNRILSHYVTLKIDESEFTSWGQFIDDSRPCQYGIYGASAAAEILANSARTDIKKLNKQGKEFLLWAYENRNSHTGWKYDFSLTIKNCCFINAFSQEEFVSNSHLTGWALERLEFFRSARLDDGSWGFYYYDQIYRDKEGAIVPTCYILLSLENKKLLGSVGDISISLEWLKKKLGNLEKIQPYEIALILHTLLILNPNKIPRNILRRTKTYLRNQAIKNSLVWDEKIIEYISVRPEFIESRYENEYYVIKSGFIILDYFCAYDSFTILHPKILARIEDIIKNINTHDGYVSSYNRIATRQNLRAYKFLASVQQMLENESYINMTFYLLMNAISSLSLVKSLLFSIFLFSLLIFVPRNNLNLGDLSLAFLISLFSGIVVEVLFSRGEI